MENLEHQSGHELSHQELLQQEWEKSQNNELIKRLRQGESFASVMESLPGFKEAFDKPLDTIDCSDGRVILGKKIGLAGSGILLSDEARAKFIEQYKGQIKRITSHEDCGAAKIKFKQLEADQNLPGGISSPDELGSLRAKELAESLGAEHVYLPMDKMANEVHNERGIVVDATGFFDASSVKDLPGHFVSSGLGFNLPEDYVLAEVETLTGIAFSDHGFDERLNEENPFYLMLIAKDEVQAEHLSAVLKAKMTAKYGAKVQVVSAVK